MIYLEFIERDRHVPIEVFQHLGNQATGWVEGGTDRMVLQLGRTLRLGPRPSYLCLWDIPDIRRLDAWEEYFESVAAQANGRSLAMHRSINIDRAGLYDTLHAGPREEFRLYVAEYCDPRAMADDDVKALFLKRAAQHPGLALAYLLRRLGHLAPDPALLAIWGVPSYSSAEPLLRAPLSGGVCTVDAGVYRSFGKETL